MGTWAQGQFWMFSTPICREYREYYGMQPNTCTDICNETRGRVQFGLFFVRYNITGGLCLTVLFTYSESSACVENTGEHEKSTSPTHSEFTCIRRIHILYTQNQSSHVKKRTRVCGAESGLPVLQVKHAQWWMMGCGRMNANSTMKHIAPCHC